MDTAEPKHGRCWGRRWMNADHLYEGSGAADGRFRAIVRRKRGVRWVMIGQGMGGIGLFVGRKPALSVRDVGEEDGRMRVFVRRYRSEGWEMLGQKMGGCKAFLRRKRNGGWEDADRLSHSNGTEDGR